MHLEDPRFPPMLKGHAVKAPKRAFAEACRGAQARRLGAGDLVWSRNTARAEMAVVLEPEVELVKALQMGPLMMVALGDSLGSLCPPKVAIMYRWPHGVVLNGALAGEVRLGAPRVAADATPQWLVVGLALQLAAAHDGDVTDFVNTSLAEEGGGEITRTDILQSVSAHFLTWLNIWQDDGFRPVHDQWLFRAEGREKPITVSHAGEAVEGLVLGLDEATNLLLKPAEGKVHSLPMLQAIEFHEPARAPR